MASFSDEELEYLSPSFDPSSLTVPRIRAILVSHDISYPASAKKPHLIEIFTQELIPRSRRILAARSRTKRTSKGITDIPSSQEGTVDGDEADQGSMPPPPTPRRGASRKSRRGTSEDTLPVPPSAKRQSDGRRASSKHARASDTDQEPELEAKRPSVRKPRRSEISPRVKLEEPDEGATQRPRLESAFSDDNPFQSGSSPPALGDRRRSAGPSKENRKSPSRRRKTEGPNIIKQEDGVVVPTSKTFEIPVSRLRGSKTKTEPDDGVVAGEEFTPEEQQELQSLQSTGPELGANMSRKRKQQSKSSVFPKFAPWTILTALLAGYAIWWRREKIEVGYCGLGQSSNALSNTHFPEWLDFIQPSCEPCPPHAFCYEGMTARCEQDFVLRPHPLSLGGLVPLAPTCEPDGEKARRVKAVADKAVEELRERRSCWECGTLSEASRKDSPTVEMAERTLKSIVSTKRRKGMTEAEFEDLWKSSIGEVTAREEVLQTDKG